MKWLSQIGNANVGNLHSVNLLVDSQVFIDMLTVPGEGLVDWYALLDKLATQATSLRDVSIYLDVELFILHWSAGRMCVL